MRSSFSSTALRVLAGPLVWATHFLAIYAITALLCERSSAQTPVLEFLPWAIACATLVAAAALFTIIAMSLRERRNQRSAARFVHWLSATLAALALLAVLWETLPAMLVPACA